MQRNVVLLVRLLAIIMLSISVDIVTAQPVEIAFLNVPVFLQQQEMQVKLEDKYINHRIAFEMEVVQQQSANLQLILLVGEPQTNLPGFYELLFSYQKVSQFRNSSIHLDVEGFATLQTFQFIDVEQLKTNQLGVWSIRVYDLNTDAKGNVELNIRVRSLGLKTQGSLGYCPMQCGNQIDATNTCMGEYGNNCKCGEGFAGNSCSIQMLQGQMNEKTQVTVRPKQWFMYWILTDAIDSWDHRVNAIALSGEFTSKLAISYGCMGELSLPSIMADVFEISQAGSGVYEYPLISERLRQLKDEEVRKKCQVRKPFRDKRLDTAIQIGFYNLSHESTLHLTFEMISVIVQKDPSVFLLNQAPVLAFLAVCCLLIFCVSPITYLILKHRRKKQNLMIMQQLFGIQNDQHHSTMQEQEGDFPGDVLSSRNAGSGIGRSMFPHSTEDTSSMGPRSESLDNQQEKIVKKIVPITRGTIDKFMPKQDYCEVVKLYPRLKDENNSECMVCLELFEDKSSCRITPCFHIFHADCLESWFAKHSTCPYCRTSCNRKGIYQQLAKSANNPYAKRLQQRKEVTSAINGSHISHLNQSGSNMEIATAVVAVETKKQQQLSMFELAGTLLKSISKPVTSFFKDHPKNLQEETNLHPLAATLSFKQSQIPAATKLEDIQSPTLLSPNALSQYCFSQNDFLMTRQRTTLKPVFSEGIGSPQIFYDQRSNQHEEIIINSIESPLPPLSQQIGQPIKRIELFAGKTDIGFMPDESQIPSTTRRMMNEYQQDQGDQDGETGGYSSRNHSASPKRNKQPNSRTSEGQSEPYINPSKISSIESHLQIVSVARRLQQKQENNCFTQKANK